MPKVLIVEDDADFLQILEKRFIASGFEVCSALDAFQATQAAHADRPDIIILDVKLPSGGGLTALKNIKLSVHTKRIPIIVSTGINDDALKKEIQEQMVAAYFEKPYEVHTMIDKAKDILNR